MSNTSPCDRLPDPNEMVRYLQSVVEKYRNVVSRELHDELGGLMIAAAMDLSAVEEQSNVGDVARQRLVRIRRTLNAAIDRERKMVEELRPSLLDVVGLIAALRSHVEQHYQSAGLFVIETYPASEPELTPEALISLFRFAQEALSLARRFSGVNRIWIKMDSSPAHIDLAIEHDGRSTGGVRGLSDDIEAFTLCSMQHRIQGLKGSLTITRRLDGGMTYFAALPGIRVIRASQMPQTGDASE